MKLLFIIFVFFSVSPVLSCIRSTLHFCGDDNIGLGKEVLFIFGRYKVHPVIYIKMAVKSQINTLTADDELSRRDFPSPYAVLRWLTTRCVAVVFLSWYPKMPVKI